MKAYNPVYVRNRAVQQQAARWHREGLLQDNQLLAIKQAYPAPFRSGNVFAEIGAFVFTGVAVGGGYSLLMLVSVNFLNGKLSFALFNLLVGLGLMAMTHHVIRKTGLYRNGPDNALIVLAASYLLTALNVVLPNETTFWLRCLLALPLLLAFVGYYGDVIMTFMTGICFYAALFSGALQVPGGKAILPFLVMGISLIVRWALLRLKKHSNVYYDDAVSMAEWLSLIALLVAGNYFVVREVNGLLSESSPGLPGRAAAPQVPLAGLFWGLTFFIPGAYLYLGLAQKNRMFLVLGLLGLGAAFTTVRYYYPLFPLPIYLTISGGLVVLGSAALIRYFRQPRNGFTDVPDEESPRQFFLHAETLGTLSATGTALGRQNDSHLGGGDFGGGGAGRGY